MIWDEITSEGYHELLSSVISNIMLHHDHLDYGSLHLFVRDGERKWREGIFLRTLFVSVKKYSHSLE